MQRRTWLAIGKLAGCAALMALLVRQVDVDKLFRELTRSDLLLVVIAILLLALSIAVNAWRWSVVMDHLGRSIGIRIAMLGSLEAMFFNQILPTGFGGDAVRVLRARDAGAPLAAAVIGALVDRSLGLLFIALTLVVAALVGGSALLGSPTFQVLAAASAGMLLGAAGAVLLGGAATPAWLPAWCDRLRDPVRALAGCVRSVGVLIRVAPLLVATNALGAVAFALCARAVRIDIGWWDALIMMHGLTLASVIPVSIGGWGVREGAAMLLFASLGVGATEAMTVSVLFGLALTMLGAVGAGVWMLNGYRTLGRLGDMPRRKLGALGAPHTKP